MDLLSYIAETTCKKKFYLRVDVFNIIFKNECSLFNLSENLLQSRCQNIKLFFSQQFDGLQHLDMSHRALYVILCQTHIKYAVIAYSEILYQVCCLCSFTPKCAHMQYTLSSFYDFRQI